MEKFVVIYESNEGGMQVFGPFDSFKNAQKWMKEDFDASLNNDDIEGLDYELETIENENSCSIEDYGSWMICELEKPC